MVLDVHNLDHSITMTTLKSGLLQYPFLFSLNKMTSACFSEILIRAEKYAQAKEGYDSHMQQVISLGVMTSDAHALMTASTELCLLHI